MEGLEFHRWVLNQRLAALDAELKFWQDQTARSNDFKRHSSQVQAFATIIKTLREAIEPNPENPVQDPSDARERSRVVLALFRIWEFLRGKLVQRSDSSFRRFLWLADEYAWLCYKPIYDQGMKEPPLVFLNGGYSPFTLTRQESFEAESVPRELLTSQRLLDAMANLPFPVIGVPWYQIQGLADLPVIGHEVGHSVEADLHLETPIRNAIEGAVDDEERRAKWISWASEVFADVYGCLGCGAAFVSALASFLSTERADAGGDSYPPPALRFQLNLAALRALQDESGANTISARWASVYEVESEWHPYRDDAAKVAQAILNNVSAAGKPVRSLIPFDQDSKQVLVLVDKVMSLSQISKGMPLRALIAAYRLAFDQFVKGNSTDKLGAELPKLKRLENAMMESLTPDVRSGEVPRSDQLVKKQAKILAVSWLKRLKQ
jgi:hypothetical protein